MLTVFENEGVPNDTSESAFQFIFLLRNLDLCSAIVIPTTKHHDRHPRTLKPDVRPGADIPIEDSLVPKVHSEILL